MYVDECKFCLESGLARWKAICISLCSNLYYYTRKPHPVSMSRWDYDTVFYRVFCITLLAVAFTFTVILTNVFVDIDGLLYKKDKGKTPKPASIQNDVPVRNDIIISDALNDHMRQEDRSEDVYDDKDYQDSNDLYRSKRSLESAQLFHIKDPKVKKILNNRLALLLDQLDEEESNRNYNLETSIEIKDQKRNKPKHAVFETHEKGKMDEYKEPLLLVLGDEDKKTKKEAIDDLRHVKENKLQSDGVQDVTKAVDKEDELLHLAIHNIILQGIIGNMNLNEVYKRVVDLVKNFEFDHANINKETKPFENNNQQVKEDNMDATMKKKMLDIGNAKRSMTKRVIDDKIVQATTKAKPKANNVMIKTIIDITTLTNDKSNKENDINSKDKINGIIKLIYNGKAMKFKRTDDDVSTNTQNYSENDILKSTVKPAQQNIGITERPIESDTDIFVPAPKYYNKVIQDYLQKHQGGSDSNEHDQIFTRKRLKRHIKIRYDHKTTKKPKVHINKKEDDELFVEIETHFDSKGAKGEKKKRLIRDLIEKIQKAIHSDKETKKKKQKHWHVKKRIQDPLGRKTAAAFINKLMLPLKSMTHRHLDPISKSVPEHEDMPMVTDDFGHNNWQRKYKSPPFFGKSINSAEMGTVDTDYDKVSSHNGIPQRLQKPLNTDMSDEFLLQDTNIVDLGKIKLLVKDIAGSGFSVGYNQYTGAAPDPETMKLFMGLENMIQTYHQKYDQDSIQDIQQKSFRDNADDVENTYTHLEDIKENPDFEMEQADQHLIKRRSIKDIHETDQHSNEYNIIFSSNFLPYVNYQDILDPNKGKTSKTKIDKNNETKKLKHSFSINENMLRKRLKPAEILSMANMFQRRKRSMNVKKISNVKMNKKISRYLNTKTMATKRVFMNKKRNKRQVDKIRIVARDLPNQHLHRDSEEDIFVVSDEKIFADRALVREVDMPEMDPNEKMHVEEHFDIISPQKEEDPYDIMGANQKVNDDTFDLSNPYLYEIPAKPYESYNNEFSRRARHNSLMSKYPHIIMEEMTKSKEEIISDTPYTYQNVYVETSTSAATVPTLRDVSPSAQDIADMILPPKDNSNYKVTVKIRPKNVTGMSGYKEVHTSINKSYNKNGLTYTSLVNVSQLSKVEKMNKSISALTKTRRDSENSEILHLKQQQELIKTLIRQHKYRIDQQLHQLNLEKQKLETMNIETTEILPDKLVDISLPNNPKKIIHLTPEEVSKLMAEDVNTTVETTKPVPVKQTTVTESSIITSTATEFILPVTMDPEKMKIISTIERNENITNNILKKIDQNTEVLKEFLGKLVNKMDVNSRRSEDAPIPVNAESSIKSDETLAVKNSEHYINMNAMTQPKPPMIVNNNIPYNFADYQQSIPNIFFRNAPAHANNTMGIPFVYAYQQPYNTVSNKDAAMASVVYHGHIHANTLNNRDLPYYYKPVETKPPINNNIPVNNVSVNNIPVNNNNGLKDNAAKPKKRKSNEFWKPKPGEKVINDFVIKNNTKFFLDDSVNDFKVLQGAVIGEDKRNYGLSLTGNNTKV